MSWGYPLKKIGIIGGGQLARMMIYQSQKLGFQFHVLENSPQCPAADLAHHLILGSLQDPGALAQLAQEVDVLTYDIEHINVLALKELESQGREIHPSPKVLEIIQDKYLQKKLYEEAGLPTAPFVLMEKDDWEKLEEKDFPCVQKLRHGGYDGRGVKILPSLQGLDQRLEGSSIKEELVDFTKELGVMVIRGKKGDTQVYPVVEMVFDPQANICDEIHHPAELESSVALQAQELALKAVEALGGVGAFGVELFLTSSGEILINEIAPRPHNSGHYTMEAARVCQFENHIRAVAGLPLGEGGPFLPAIMVNLLGEGEGSTQLPGLEEALAIPGFSLHLYGKAQCRKGRKMGHFTLVGEDFSQLLLKKNRIKPTFKTVGEGQ